ncbi:MAG: LysR substrate-binding domain-containing protein [Clostridium sp.]
MLETARQIAKTEQELQDALTSLKQTALQNVRIYIEYTMRNMFLKDIWPKVLKLYPQARLTLTAGDCENAWQFLENDVVDLLIVNTRTMFSKPCIQQIFHQDSYLLAASRSRYQETYLIERMKSKGSWKYDRVFMKDNFSLFPSLQQQAMEQTGLADCPNIVKTSTYQEAARLCCEKEGLSILPESLFHIIEADLLHIPLPEPFFVKGLLVWREEQALNPLYPCIRKLLEERYQEL